MICCADLQGTSVDVAITYFKANPVTSQRFPKTSKQAYRSGFIVTANSLVVLFYVRQTI